MVHGYETREEMIQDHWRRYGYHWNAGEWPRLCLPIRHKQYPYMSFEPDSDPPAFNSDYKLEFSLERGTLEGRPAVRIVCEGIVVEEATI